MRGRNYENAALPIRVLHSIYAVVKTKIVYTIKRIPYRAKISERREVYESLKKELTGEYEKWITKKESMYDTSEEPSYQPLISILVPVYKIEERYLDACVESVMKQIYSNWELCLVDDCSSDPSVREKLQKYADQDSRIKVNFREQNGGISAATNSALEMATGEFVAFLDNDDLLHPNALYEVVKVLDKDRELDFIYSDEDKIDDDGNNRHEPYFKPDWSPDTMFSFMYTCHLAVYRRTLIEHVGGLRSEYDGAQDYDLVLRIAEKTDKIAHISKILYHWRQRIGSTAENPEAKDYVKEATRKCKEDALKRRGIKASLEYVDEVYQYRVNYDPVGNPLVSVVIPSKDNPSILKQCLSSMANLTEYKQYELVVVDNGSSPEHKAQYEALIQSYGGRYIYEPMQFNFSRMCNIGAQVASGDYLLFLNDDIEIIDGKWMSRMLGQAVQTHVGAVGAKLLYPGGSLIQHDGVADLSSGPVHVLAKMDDQIPYYFNRNILDFDVSSVTAACLLISREKFRAVGGFEENLAVAYNDIDLCYKLVEAGYYNVIRNDAVLYHHESFSRGDDAMDETKFQRLMEEQRKLYDAHPRFRGIDSFYNENLTQENCDFSFRYESEIADRVRACDATEIRTKYKHSRRMLCGINVVRYDWQLFVEGWGFYSGQFERLEQQVTVLLLPKEGTGTAYEISTERVQRPDVVDVFDGDWETEFSGFRARVSRGEIEPGMYELLIACEGYYTDTGRRIEIKV